MKWLRKIHAAFTLSGVRRNGVMPHDSALLDHVSFGRELRRRRAAVDRAGGRFVLLVFDDSGNGRANGAAPYPALLGSVLLSRARISDIVGYYDATRRSLAVILPETDEAGTGRFILSVETMLRTECNRRGLAATNTKCLVSQYPEVAAPPLADPAPAAAQGVDVADAKQPAGSGIRR
jgi:hypothetical protein